LHALSARQDFFAMTCHEIRNPLNSTIGNMRAASMLVSSSHAVGMQGQEELRQARCSRDVAKV